MNDIHNNENISQEEEFVSPGQEKVNGKATPEQSGPSTGEPREQPGEPTEEAVEIEETEEIEIIEAGEFTVPKKEEEEEEIQELHTKHPRRDVPVIDHRLLAGKLTVYDWLEDLPATDCAPEIVEVRFKNTRKGFYSNPSKLALKAGDIVAVEAALGTTPEQTGGSRAESAEEGIPEGQTPRHREMATSHCFRARYDDPFAENRSRPETEYEDR